jgi:hypothetical protein
MRTWRRPPRRARAAKPVPGAQPVPGLEGFVSLFDGKTLDGWQGDPKGEQIHLTFLAESRVYTIRLNKTGAIGGHIRIDEGGKAMVDKDLAREIQPQAARR